MYLDGSGCLSFPAIDQFAAIGTCGIRHQGDAAQGTAHIRDDRPLGLSGIRATVGVFSLHADISVTGKEGGTSGGQSHFFQFRTDVGGEPVVPVLVADMFLSHHTVPLTTGYLFVVLQVQQGVALEGLTTSFCPAVCLGIALLCQFQVHSLGVVHLVDVTHCLYREEDNLSVGILVFGLQRDKLAQGTSFQGLVFCHYLGKLFSGISRCIEHLRGDTTIVFADEIQDRSCLTGLIFAEALCTESTGMTEQVVCVVFLGIPCHVHEELDGVFHWLQVAHIQDPEFLDAAVVGQLQLFPHVLCRGDVDPLGVTRRTHVVHMIVEAPTAFTFLFLSGWQSAYITPVVIAEQYGDIVRHAQAGIVVVLHLFIESPDLWCLLSRALGNLLDNAALVVDDILQKFSISAVAHRLVTIATHTNGYNVISPFHALDALTEETVEVLLVSGVVPGTPALSVAGILLMVTCHRLMVRGTHHDAHRISCLQVLRIIGIESPAPHSGPQVVTLQAQDELKHLLIEAVVTVVRTEGVLYPRGQTRCLVVQKQTTVTHGGLTVGVFTFYYIEVAVFLYGHISPIVPG